MEYPRAEPDGEQMDFVEAIELNGEGLIQHHCVYWGWRGVSVILGDAYRRYEPAARLIPARRRIQR